MSAWRYAVQHSGFVELKALPDPLYGDLYVAEAGVHVPFPIQRVYFIQRLVHTDGVRGSHAHRHLQQVIVAASGSFTLHLDDGMHTCDIIMNDPARGVLLGPMLWHTMADYSPDCLMLVFASAPYDEADYIRDYATFKSLVRIGGAGE